MTKLSKNCFMMLWTPISSGAKSFPISFAEIELLMCGWRSPRIVAKNWFTSRSCSTISGASFINGRSLWCSSTRSSHCSCRGNHVIARGKSETYVDLNWLWSKVVDLILFRHRSEYTMIYVDINWKRTMIVDLNWSKSTVVDLNWFLYATHILDLSWFKIYCWKCKLIKIYYCRLKFPVVDLNRLWSKVVDLNWLWSIVEDALM